MESYDQKYIMVNLHYLKCANEVANVWDTPFRGNKETRVTDANGESDDVHVGYNVWAGVKWSCRWYLLSPDKFRGKLSCDCC